MAEEIGPPGERSPTPDLGIPVQYSGPIPEIVDLLHRTQGPVEIPSDSD